MKILQWKKQKKTQQCSFLPFTIDVKSITYFDTPNNKCCSLYFSKDLFCQFNFPVSKKKSLFFFFLLFFSICFCKEHLLTQRYTYHSCHESCSLFSLSPVILLFSFSDQYNWNRKKGAEETLKTRKSSDNDKYENKRSNTGSLKQAQGKYRHKNILGEKVQ